jgi:NAD(P)-dependent dehydrogenase (short-subunit alcohol dehydrogenase family)
VALIQAMLPLLKKSKHGRIVNMSSSLGSLTLPSDPKSTFADFLALGYDTSKSALNGRTIHFAKELKDRPIR